MQVFFSSGSKLPPVDLTTRYGKGIYRDNVNKSSAQRLSAIREPTHLARHEDPRQVHVFYKYPFWNQMSAT